MKRPSMIHSRVLHRPRGRDRLARERWSAARRPACSAFTLIELLVVIAIIAILAAILVPAVSQGLVRAQVTYCASSLHQIGVASFSYANDNEGKIPEVQKGSQYVDSLGKLFLSRWMRRGSDRWVGIGELYGGGYAEGQQVYFCPTQQGADYKLSSYEPWPTSLSSAQNSGNGIRCGYSYSPMIVGPRDPTRLLNSLDAVADPTKALLAVDVLEPPSLASQHPGPGWNLLSADGAAWESKSETAYQLMVRDEAGIRSGNYSLYYRMMLELLDQQY